MSKRHTSTLQDASDEDNKIELEIEFDTHGATISRDGKPIGILDFKGNVLTVYVVDENGEPVDDAANMLYLG